MNVARDRVRFDMQPIKSDTDCCEQLHDLAGALKGGVYYKPADVRSIERQLSAAEALAEAVQHAVAALDIAGSTHVSSDLWEALSRYREASRE